MFLFHDLFYKEEIVFWFLNIYVVPVYIIIYSFQKQKLAPTKTPPSNTKGKLNGNVFIKVKLRNINITPRRKSPSLSVFIFIFIFLFFDCIFLIMTVINIEQIFCPF